MTLSVVLFRALRVFSPLVLTLSASAIAGAAPSYVSTFVPVVPCRIIDTRNPTGAFGGPKLAAGSTRTVSIPTSACNIPTGASAYSLNVTVVPDSVLGYLSIWASGQGQPTVSTLNSDGRVKANAAIVPAGADGGVSVFVSHASHVILDINGYFMTGRTGYYYHPIAPCRVIDTRNANGSFGGPFLAAGQARTVPVLSSPCRGLLNPTAYAVNMTAVPREPIGFVSTWPTGQPQVGLVSTLNAPTGIVTANAAIVPAGTAGSIDVYSSNKTDVVVDINGYFSASTDGLVFYPMTPCRVTDTRSNSGSPLTGSIVQAISSTSCGSVAASAKALVLNATVIPSQNLGFLSLYPDGGTWPGVSTLNAPDQAITSNMAITSTTNGSIDILASNLTNVVLDLSGYFANDVQSSISFPALFPITHAFNVIHYPGPNNTTIVAYTLDDLTIGAAAQQALVNMPLPTTVDQTFVNSPMYIAPDLPVALVYVPTAAERSGDYSAWGTAIYDPMTAVPPVSLGQTFSRGIVPAARLGSVFFFRVRPCYPEVCSSLPSQ